MGKQQQFCCLLKKENCIITNWHDNYDEYIVLYYELTGVISCG